MRKLTAEQILEAIEKNYDVWAFAYNDILSLKEDSKIKIPTGLGSEEQKKKNALLDLIVKESREQKISMGSHPRYEEYNKTEGAFQIQEKYVLEQLGLGKIDEVEQYGGEDQGSTWYSVKHFVDHDVYIKTEGYYTSYNGTDFDEGYGGEVKPTERTVIVYE